MVASVLKYQRSSTKRVSSPLIVYINPTWFDSTRRLLF